MQTLPSQQLENEQSLPTAAQVIAATPATPLLLPAASPLPATPAAPPTAALLPPALSGIPVITDMITAVLPALATPLPALGCTAPKLLKSKQVLLTQVKPVSHCSSTHGQWSVPGRLHSKDGSSSQLVAVSRNAATSTAYARIASSVDQAHANAANVCSHQMRHC